MSLDRHITILLDNEDVLPNKNGSSGENLPTAKKQQYRTFYKGGKNNTNK